MSLRVWLPLTKDLRNQGLNHVQSINVQTGCKIDDNGKLGKCYTNSGTTVNVANAVPFSASKFSACAWVKLNTRRNNWCRAFGMSGNGTYFGLGCEHTNGTSLGFHYYKTIDGTNTAIFDSYPVSVGTGTWNHFVMCYDGTKYYIYQNGNLVASADARKANIDCNMTTLYLFGGTANNYSQCSLNDVRIYDHCLSPMEVKELSKGLVLHYPLNRGGWGQENLVTNSSSEWSAWYTPSVNGTNQTSSPGTATLPASKNVGDIYSCSVEIEFSGVSAGSDGTFAFRAQGSSTSGWVGGNPWSKSFFSGTVPANGIYRYAWTGSITSASVNDTTFSCGFRADYWGGGKYRVRLIKMEPGEISTPWCPHSSQAAYTTMGLNGTTEYDCSGFCNNGTRTGTFSWTSDTPKYAVNTNFAAVGTIINNTSPIHLSNEFTIAWWGKINSWKKNWEGMFLLQNNATLNAGTNTYDIMSTLHASRANSMSFTICQNSSSYIFDRYKWTYTIGVWAHYTCTYKAGVITMYQNGISIYTETITDNSSNDYYYRLGYRANSCDCQLSDFRIYATALSADDVKSLYQNSAYIDSSGNVYGAVHSEV